MLAVKYLTHTARDRNVACFNSKVCYLPIYTSNNNNNKKLSCFELRIKSQFYSLLVAHNLAKDVEALSQF